MRNFSSKMLVVILLAFGCSEPEIIIPPFEIPTSGQNVMIEELTGVRCPNCPSAAARLESIKLLYGDNIILVNIHGNLLTRPLPESKFDFRNDDASALEESFKPLIGKPSVIINRKIHPEFELLANPLQDQWQNIVENELQLEQTITLTSSIEASSAGYELSIGSIPLSSLSGKYFLHVYLTENNIIDAQEDVDRIIPDYKHDHVLRKIITPRDGNALPPLDIPDKIINSQIAISNTTFDATWVEENMELVIFITNDEGHVIQVVTNGLTS